MGGSSGFPTEAHHSGFEAGAHALQRTGQIADLIA
jgi:hypothetical protein